jgi:hypothetical protein
MPRVPFDTLPDHGRLWVFPMSRRLAAEDRDALLREVDAFLDRWAAHGKPLRSGRELVEDRFLLIGVDVDAEAPSGCSIDALVNNLVTIARGRGFTLTDHDPVRYRDGDDIAEVSRTEFKRLARGGSLAADVRVFDTTLTRVGPLRSGGLERPARESWHGKAFFEGGRPAEV